MKTKITENDAKELANNLAHSIIQKEYNDLYTNPEITEIILSVIEDDFLDNHEVIDEFKTWYDYYMDEISKIFAIIKD